jgi:hypothetical protein
MPPNMRLSPFAFPDLLLPWRSGLGSSLYDGTTSIPHSVYNIGSGAGAFVYDLGAVPVDLAANAYGVYDPYYQGGNFSYLGASTNQAVRQGASLADIEGNLGLNVATLGVSGLLQAGADYAQTGDPTNFQQ